MERFKRPNPRSAAVFGFERRTRALLEGVARTGSVSEAAREVGMAPSNALRHLRLASRREGTELVRAARGGRGGGRAELTRAGHSFLREATLGAAALVEGTLWKGLAYAFDPLDGVTHVRVGQRDVLVAGQALRGPVTLGITADAVVLERIHRRIARTGSEKGPKPAPPSEREGSARNAWRVRVDRVEESKERPSVQLVLCSLTGGLPLVAAVTLGAARTLRIRPRAHLLARVKATAIRVEGRFAPSH